MTTLSTAAQNAACDATTALVNGGTLRLLAGATTVVDLPFEATAFGAASSGVATAASFPKEAAASATGVIDGFEARSSGGAVIWSGSVAEGSGGDINLDNTDINSGQTVRVTSFTHTQPASA